MAQSKHQNTQPSKIKTIRGLNTLLLKTRIQKRLTQREVAKLLGHKNSQYISNIERNICSPSIEAVEKLIKIYDLDRKIVVLEMINDYKEIICKRLL